MLQGPAVISPRQFLNDIFQAAVDAAQPALCLPPHLPAPPKGRTVVIGAGKASAAMARVLETHWDGLLSGLVVTRYGHRVDCERIDIVESSHPVPDAAGVAAAEGIVARLQGLTEDDLVICLISGGGSALMTLPMPGLTLDDKISVNRALLRSGANIAEMNCVRKHLSAVKGGRLAAAAAPARLVTLAISDVPGDDLAVIASGPTVPDPTTFAEARDILARYGVSPPAPVAAFLATAAEETPKPGDPRLANCRTVLIAAPQASLEAAAAVARRAGVTPVILGDAIEGESREVAIVHAGIARQVARHGQPAGAPAVLLSGGETTVTVRGNGRGGRNAEFALGLAIALDGAAGISAIACDTDGIDGSEDNAGVLVTPDTLARSAARGINARALLDANDAYSLFSALDDLVMTGPTLTNVNDFRAVLIE
ncbi:MAG: glycerate kinase [Proteobacteria bacterium]|nr:glycerate kinase [Pseudomonadota bacterium]